MDSSTPWLPPRRRFRLVITAALLVVLAWPLAAAGSASGGDAATTLAPSGVRPSSSISLSSDPQGLAQERQADRRAGAHDLEFYAPYYSIGPDVDTELFLMNTFPDPLQVRLTALSPEGDPLSLGTFPVESLHHIELSLRELLAGFGEEFSSGSLRLSIVGDVDALQGWAVVRGERTGTLSLRIAAPEAIGDRDFLAFWSVAEDSQGTANAVDLYLLNTTGAPLAVRLSPAGQAANDTLTVPPRSRVRVPEPSDPGHAHSSWVRVSHDGTPGDLLVVGIAGGDGPLARVEVVPGAEITSHQRFESIPLPASISIGRSSLTLFNPGQEPRSVSIRVLDAERGTEDSRLDIHLDAQATRTLPLGALLRGAKPPVRLSITADSPPLLAHVTAWSGRYPHRVSLFPYEKVHAMGTYPLPNLQDFKTVTTLVNLAPEDARVAFQVYWQGGTYSIAPMTIPADGSKTVDLEQLAESTPPDLLGRTLDTARPEGVVKWRAMSADAELIGRTEVQERHRDDGFGFDCFGCCPETATGLIVPSDVSFTPSQNPSFDACVTVQDCTGGTMGPYHASVSSTTVPAPFSWNTYNITSSTAADGDVLFTGSEVVMKVTCHQGSASILGLGRAEMCQKTFNPKGYDPKKTCTSQTNTCTDCNTCCSNLYSQNICQGKNHDLAFSEYQACMTNCLTDRCN